MEVRGNIKLLKDAVANATVDHRLDEERKATAEIRLAAAYAELEAAMRELAAITAASGKSLEESLASVGALQEYASVEAEKTKKARRQA